MEIMSLQSNLFPACKNRFTSRIMSMNLPDFESEFYPWVKIFAEFQFLPWLSIVLELKISLNANLFPDWVFSLCEKFRWIPIYFQILCYTCVKKKSLNCDLLPDWVLYPWIKNFVECSFISWLSVISLREWFLWIPIYFFFFGGTGRISMYLQIIDSITSSAPPPIDKRRKSLQ
jgi:hypothetical protein